MSTLKRGSLIMIMALCVMIADVLYAQNPRIQHEVVKRNRVNTSAGRDLWFAMIQNYENQGGKYYEIYVTSPNKTVVNIQITGGSTIRIPINAFGVAAYKVPLGWEMTSSGTVEDKGIRIWSTDADLTAYLLSRNPATSDGMFIVPTVGWGKEYVVAAFHALYELTFDYPSEFSVVSNQDNTLINIVPNSDIRDGSSPDIVKYRKDQYSAAIRLDRGQAIQFKTARAQDGDNFDMTGSMVYSTNPVGVVGGSQCPNIPVDFTYCDHVCDMIPPIRTWALTYYTLPFASRRGGDGFLVISSKVGQTIYRNGAVYANLGTQYEHYFRHDITEASKWTSDAPFMLVQYINSTTWVDDQGRDNNGIGDPAMVIVNAKEQFTNDVVFQTPTITDGGAAFQNFVNIIVHKDAANNTTLDAVKIGSYAGVTQSPIDADYIGYRVRAVKPGSHIVKSDSGVGVYVYGYGSYDSYAWAGSLGIRTFNDPDTISPNVSTPGDCYCATVGVGDSHIEPPASKLNEIYVDSVSNMTYEIDPTFVSGALLDTSFYTMCVTDPTKAAMLRMVTYDASGNQTIVTSTYQPMAATVTPQIINFGTGINGIKTYDYFTITNTGVTPYTIEELILILNDKGFAIDSGATTDIPVGETRRVKISFDPGANTATRTDTLLLDDGCLRLKALLVGNGGSPDFLVPDYNFGCHLVNRQIDRQELTIINTSTTQPLTITNITVNDPRFTYVPGFNGNPPFNIVLNGGAPPLKLWISFTPDAVGSNFQAQVTVSTLEAGDKMATLTGCGIAPAAKITNDTITSTLCELDIPLIFTVSDTGTAPVTITNVVVEGDPNFLQPTQFTDRNNNTIAGFPYTLQPNDFFRAFVMFDAPAKATGVYTATIYAVTADGDTTDPATMTVNAVYREAEFRKDSITYPNQAFGSPKVNDVFTVCNPLPDPLTITGVAQINGPYNAAFAVTGYTINGNPATLPFDLAQGECADVIVEFDPSVIATNDTLRSLFAITSNACLPNNVQLAQATLGFDGPSILGFTAPLTFSCNTVVDSVIVVNPNLPGSGADLTIQSINIAGGSTPGNFVLGTPLTMTIVAGTSLAIPVTFVPTSGVNLTSYDANVEVVITDVGGAQTTLSALISGSSVGITTQISSQFAIADQAVVAGQGAIKLPIDLSVTNTGNGAGDLSQAGIGRITLVYRYNTDLLSVITDVNGNPVASFTPSPSWGGTVDASASSIVEGTQGTLTLTLSGPALSNGMNNLGTISFNPMLTLDQSTTVQLESATYAQADNTPVPGCVTVQTDATQTALVYQCGDQTLVDRLNGRTPTYIEPVHPNPVTAVTGKNVTFRYAMRYEGHVTLSVFDELGRQVATVVNGMYHPAGGYQVAYDVSRLTSGSYTYRLQVDKYTTSGRLIVNH